MSIALIEPTNVDLEKSYAGFFGTERVYVRVIFKKAVPSESVIHSPRKCPDKVTQTERSSLTVSRDELVRLKREWEKIGQSGVAETLLGKVDNFRYEIV